MMRPTMRSVQDTTPRWRPMPPEASSKVNTPAILKAMNQLENSPSSKDSSPGFRLGSRSVAGSTAGVTLVVFPLLGTSSDELRSLDDRREGALVRLSFG
jgi:hypothetical protein